MLLIAFENCLSWPEVNFQRACAIMQFTREHTSGKARRTPQSTGVAGASFRRTRIRLSRTLGFDSVRGIHCVPFRFWLNSDLPFPLAHCWRSDRYSAGISRFRTASPRYRFKDHRDSTGRIFQPPWRWHPRHSDVHVGEHRAAAAASGRHDAGLDATPLQMPVSGSSSSVPRARLDPSGKYNCLRCGRHFPI